MLSISIASCRLPCNLAICLSDYLSALCKLCTLSSFSNKLYFLTPLLSPDSSHTESLTPWSDLSIWLGVFHRPCALFLLLWDLTTWLHACWRSSATVVWLLCRVALFACVQLQLPVLYPVPSFAITLLAGRLAWAWRAVNSWLASCWQQLLALTGCAPTKWVRIARVGSYINWPSWNSGESPCPPLPNQWLTTLGVPPNSIKWTRYSALLTPQYSIDPYLPCSAVIKIS